MKMHKKLLYTLMALVCCAAAGFLTYSKNTQNHTEAEKEQAGPVSSRVQTAEPTMARISSARRGTLDLPPSVLQIRAVVRAKHTQQHMKEWGKLFEKWTPEDVEAAIAEVHRMTTVKTAAPDDLNFTNYYTNHGILSIYSQLFQSEYDTAPHHWDFLKALFERSAYLKGLAKGMNDDGGCSVSTVFASFGKLMERMDQQDEEQARKWVNDNKSLPGAFPMCVSERIRSKYFSPAARIEIISAVPNLEPPPLLTRP